MGFVCRSLWLPRGHRYEVAVSIFHCTSSSNILKHHRVGKNIIPAAVSVLLAVVIFTVFHRDRSATASTSRHCLLPHSDNLNLFCVLSHQNCHAFFYNSNLTDYVFIQSQVVFMYRDVLHPNSAAFYPYSEFT